jgi:hypothetical protein
LLASLPARADIIADVPRPPSAAATYLTGESRREACVNTKADAFLPEISLPDPSAPGTQALGWRPVGALREHPEWLRWGLAAGLIVLGGAALRRRTDRQAALVLALGPLALGLAESQRQLGRLGEGLSLPFSCVPREGVFQRLAQLSRDATAAGALVSLVLLAALSLLLFATPAASATAPLATATPRWRHALAPLGLAALLLALLLWGGAQRWQEQRLARAVSDLVIALEKSPIELPATRYLRPERLPDVPLLLVGADGALRYDDQRGQRPPVGAPLLEPYEGVPSSTDPLDRPPFFLLAIDRATPWSRLLAALEPLSSRGYAWRQWLLFGPVTHDAPGSPPQAPVIVFWAPEPPVPSDLSFKRARYNRSTLLGLWTDRGFELEGPLGPVGAGCATPGDSAAIPRADLGPESLRRCLDSLEASTSLGFSRSAVMLILPAPATPWREVAWLLDELSRPRPDATDGVTGFVSLHLADKPRMRESFREQQIRERDLQRQESAVLESLGRATGLELGPAPSAAPGKPR